jgi:hypothetical protein
LANETMPLSLLPFLTGSFPSRFQELPHSGHQVKKVLTFMKSEDLLPYSHVKAMNLVVSRINPLDTLRPY